MRNDETLDTAKEHLYLMIGYRGQNFKPRIAGKPEYRFPFFRFKGIIFSFAGDGGSGTVIAGINAPQQNHRRTIWL